MKKEDIYTIHIVEGGRIYLKNNLLHREAGPAFVPTSSVHLYGSLSDHSLYKLISNSPATINALNNFLKEPINFIINNKIPYFFLEGFYYDRREFYSLMEKKHINKELHRELPISNINNKKIKL
jgi:hypothetical protein